MVYLQHKDGERVCQSSTHQKQNNSWQNLLQKSLLNVGYLKSILVKTVSRDTFRLSSVNNAVTKRIKKLKHPARFVTFIFFWYTDAGRPECQYVFFSLMVGNVRTELLSKQIKHNKFNCKKRLLFEFNFKFATGVLSCTCFSYSLV